MWVGQGKDNQLGKMKMFLLTLKRFGWWELQTFPFELADFLTSLMQILLRDGLGIHIVRAPLCLRTTNTSQTGWRFAAN